MSERRHGRGPTCCLAIGVLSVVTLACAGPSRAAGGRTPFGPSEPDVATAVAAPAVSAPPIPSFSVNRTRGGLGGAWIPWMTLDLNEDAKNAGTPPASIDDGQGWVARAGTMQDTLGTDIVFATTQHDETRTGAELTTYALYVDFIQAQQLWHGTVEGWAGVGLGLGLIRFDWDRTYQSEMTGLWQGEALFALQIARHITLDARAAGFIAAHPGRSAGLGALAMLGGGITF